MQWGRTSAGIVDPVALQILKMPNKSEGVVHCTELAAALSGF